MLCYPMVQHQYQRCRYERLSESNFRTLWRKTICLIKSSLVFIRGAGQRQLSLNSKDGYRHQHDNRSFVCAFLTFQWNCGNVVFSCFLSLSQWRSILRDSDLSSEFLHLIKPNLDLFQVELTLIISMPLSLSLALVFSLSHLTYTHFSSSVVISPIWAFHFLFHH